MGAGTPTAEQSGDGQHNLLTWTEGRLGMSDAEHAEARTHAELEAEA